jgi:type IV fimbrial biogenesis protein FimT
MKNRSRGFTLFELMVVVALAAVILGLGAPQFREFTRNNRMVTVANDFLGGIQTARTEAIKRQLAKGSIALCPSSNPDDANPTCLGSTTRQFNGWIVFVDTNDNCDRDTADATEIVLRTGSRIDTNNTVNSNRKSISTGACISFAPTGFMRTAAEVPRTLANRTLFCDERGNTKQKGIDLSVARGLDISPTGRARITRDVTEIAGWEITCPT